MTFPLILIRLNCRLWNFRFPVSLFPLSLSVSRSEYCWYDDASAVQLTPMFTWHSIPCTSRRASLGLSTSWLARNKAMTVTRNDFFANVCAIHLAFRRRNDRNRKAFTTYVSAKTCHSKDPVWTLCSVLRFHWILQDAFAGMTSLKFISHSQRKREPAMVYVTIRLTNRPANVDFGQRWS